jgi:hypothetical protein
MIGTAMRSAATRATALAALLAAGLACSADCSASAVPAAPAAAVIPAGWRTAGPGMLGAGRTGSRAEVPWRKIGPGWALADYWATTGGTGLKPVKRGPATLYLVDPLGGRYVIDRWPARNPGSESFVLDWSGNARRALLWPFSGTGNRLFQLDLQTGHVTAIRLPRNAQLAQYDGPAARSLVAGRYPSRNALQADAMVRDSLRGQPRQVLVSGHFPSGVAVFSPDGSAFAVAASDGIDLVKSTGGLIRRLQYPVQGQTCDPVAWRSAGTIQVSCDSDTAAPGFFSRLWLQPVTGSAPSPLTGPATSKKDEGYVGAWQLASGLYLQGATGCETGRIVIARQPRHSPLLVIRVPGSEANVIVAASRTRLLLQQNRCTSGTLAWFNPVTRKLTTVIKASRGALGVIATIAYPWPRRDPA